MSDQHFSEEWREVEGFPGYFVSSLGSIKSAHNNKWGLAARRHLLGLRATKFGHRYVDLLSGSGQRVRRYVHHLVLEAFVGLCPPGMEAMHRDDDPANNRLGNLAWGTHQENIDQCCKRDRQSRGERNAHAKLTAPAVKEIMDLLANTSMTQAAIGRQFGITQSAVSRLKQGNRWKHLLKTG